MPIHSLCSQWRLVSSRSELPLWTKHQTIISRLGFILKNDNNAKEACPFFSGDKILHKNFEDPSSFKGSEEEILKEIRRVRDEIKVWIEETFGIEPSKTR